MDVVYVAPQEVFETSAYMSPGTYRAFMVVDEVQTKHKAHVMEHGKWPEAYWDDIEAAAAKYGFEFTHPKYTEGPKMIGIQSTTVH